MNKTKKFLSIIFAILMIVTSVPFAYAANSTLTVNMYDSYGDGWNDATIDLYRIADGELSFIDTIEFEDEAEEASYSCDISGSDILAFKWINGRYDDECSFDILIDGEIVYSAESITELHSSGYVFYCTCTHEFTEDVCDVCGVVCGTDIAHDFDSEAICTTCGYTCVSHNWNRGVCTFCDYIHTDHEYDDDYRCECGVLCSHEDFDGVCNICGSSGQASVEIDGTVVNFASVSDAIEYACEAESAKIKLLSDVYSDYLVFDSGTIEFDLNGKTIEAEGYLFHTEETADVTFKDSVGTGMAYSSSDSCAVFTLSDASKITVESGSYKSNSCIFLNANGLSNTADLIINGGTFVSDYSVISSAAEQIVVNGGSFTAEIFVYVNNWCSLTVKNEIECNTSETTFSLNEGATVDISEAVFDEFTFDLYDTSDIYTILSLPTCYSAVRTGINTGTITKYAPDSHDFDIDTKICNDCGLCCGEDFAHAPSKADINYCTCGTYIYAITHQPTTDEPYVELNGGEGAVYQWKKVKSLGVEITDEKASGDWSCFNAPDYIFGEYNEDTGWSSESGYYFTIDLDAGDVVTLVFSEAVDAAYCMTEDFWEKDLQVKGNYFIYTAEKDGMHGFYCYPPEDSLGDPESVEFPDVKAYIGKHVTEKIEDATSAELLEDTGLYYCEIVVADGSILSSFYVEINHEHTWTDGECDCGKVCSHLSTKEPTYFTSVVCAVCGMNITVTPVEHKDTDKDHKCDYGCSAVIGICADADKDHKCDYGCGKEYGTHEDKNSDTVCDYGCKTAIAAAVKPADTTADAEEKDDTPVTKVKKPAKVKNLKVKSLKAKRAVITWKVIKASDGYEVQYSTSKKFKKKLTKKVTVKKAKKSKITVKKLKSGKKYFVKVRAYKTVNGKKLFGAFSKVKTVKVK